MFSPSHMDGFLRVAEDDMVGGLPHEPVDNSSDNFSFLGLRSSVFGFSMIKNKNGSHVGCHSY
ncbi:hypothetical protein [Shewanella frigidimarina]|uniref:hypothetical protein n=1 Tax=Shewanella frigidimarina TaxID=56812 RepID=UPI000F4D47BD|nr:hypothetical protein [Shewanella frigidimarina]